MLAASLLLSSVYAQQLIPLPAPGTRAVTELLTNPSFEIDANADKIPDGWTAKNTAITGADKRKCDKPDKLFARTGSCAFQFKGNSDSSKSTLQQKLTDTSALVDGTVVTLSAYIDLNGAAINSTFAQAVIKFSNGSKQTFKLLIPNDQLRLDYSQVTDTQTVNIPAGASITSAKVSLMYEVISGKYLVDDISFAIFTVDPTFTPTYTFTPAGTATSTPVPEPWRLIADSTDQNDWLGYSVDFSLDSDTVIVGAIRADFDRGAAYIFVRNGNTWQQQAHLGAGTSGGSIQFGTSVALSGDGNTALIGASLPHNGQVNAYVYVRTGTTWGRQAVLNVSDDAPNQQFGIAVALSANGNTALIGADQHDVTAIDQGAVYVFTRNGTLWSQEAKLAASDAGADDYFGRSVTLNGDGNIALIGSIGDTVDGKVGQGSAYVFTRNNTIWTQQSKLIANDGKPETFFGRAVALNADGNTALVGSDWDDIGAKDKQGSAYVFTRNGTVWAEQAKLIASDGGMDDQFGVSVALNTTGDRALVGAHFVQIGDNFGLGAAYAFTRSGTTWAEQAKLTTEGLWLSQFFGFAVALNGTGTIALIGAYQDDNAAGAAYILPMP
ncbi:MAG: hypothetical protein H7Y11_11545 [Armatimonadetes bacterium]|nr:hypothetical protein [Anaerolineae bacterium]